MNETKTETAEAPTPQHMLYLVTLTRTKTETREMLVYGFDEADALDSADRQQNDECEYVLYDGEWEDYDEENEESVEERGHELKDYAPEIAAAQLDAKIEATLTACTR